MQACGGGQRFAYVYIPPSEGRRVKDATRALVNHPGHNYADTIARGRNRFNPGEGWKLTQGITGTQKDKKKAAPLRAA